MGLNVDRDVLALLGVQRSLLIFLLCYMIEKMAGSHSFEHQMWRSLPRAELGREMPLFWFLQIAVKEA